MASLRLAATSGRSGQPPVLHSLRAPDWRPENKCGPPAGALPLAHSAMQRDREVCMNKHHVQYDHLLLNVCLPANETAQMNHEAA